MGNDKHRRPGSAEQAARNRSESPARRAWTAAVSADYRTMGSSELSAEIESLEFELADAAHYDATAAEVVRLLSGERLRLAQAELARRERHAAGGTAPDPHAAPWRQWRDLAREVRERVDILELLETAGVHLERSGRQWRGPCPSCGGSRRFVVWRGDDGRRPRVRCWVCGFSGDALDCYRTLLVPGASFFAAVRVLALQLGLRTPDFGSQRRIGGLGTIRENGATGPKNDSQEVIPLRERSRGNQRRPAVRFERGRAVAS